MEKFNIIYADPPWKYRSRNIHSKFGGGAAAHYNLMTMEEIKNLPINELADENCALFLWVTFPLLDEQIKMFKEWGFSYKTLGFSWIKTNKNDKKPCFGVGYYTKSNCEVCLLGVKGQMKPVSIIKFRALLFQSEENTAESQTKLEIRLLNFLEIFHELNYLQEKNLMVGKLGAMK